jgi:hypothetical protein
MGELFKITSFGANNLSIIDLNKLSTTNSFFNLLRLILFKHKQNEYFNGNTIDCLVYSILKKLSQLTSRLFGSLFVNDLVILLLNKNIISSIDYSLKNDYTNKQAISSICDFTTELIINQTGFFNNFNKLNDDGSSIFNKLINLLKESHNVNDRFNENYKVVESSVFNCIYTVWSNKKYDLVNYCKAK